MRQRGHDNDRSYLFGYDDLQQLTFAELGRLNNENSSIVPDPLVTLRRRSRWTLDNLSNWRGENIGTQNEVPGFEREDFKLGNSSAETPDVSRALTHAVDSANQITTAEVDITAGGGPTTQADRAYRYDRAGNRVFDGDFVYAYDGLNHLSAVYERGQSKRSANPIFTLAVGVATISRSQRRQSWPARGVGI